MRPEIVSVLSLVEQVELGNEQTSPEDIVILLLRLLGHDQRGTPESSRRVRVVGQMVKEMMQIKGLV